MRKTAAASALLAAALCVTAGATGTAQATDGVVNYTATTTETSTVITTDAGSLDVDNGVLKIKAPNGDVIAGTELSFRVDEFVFPIAADIVDRTVTLTPLLSLAHAEYKPVALPFEDKAPWKSEYDREKDAWTRMTSTISLGAAVAALVGGIGGAGVGCILGGIAGATIASATIVGLFGPFIPAAAVGCIGGILAMGSLGAVAGQILITAPVAIMAAVQYFTTINSPMPNQPAK
ncbi:hypothetical protein IU431_15235 [Nocardia otitidiscaviarum]|uniref:membrane protein n=1 Tax=Nocardia otitidiscaviarum TaxID=1823 RepID=UPI0005BB8571|nr:membrane protein [Nocardia otitidiscaviarum]MBF6485487.1 hypothetical protein [Nocardia otitidiscaviarum]